MSTERRADCVCVGRYSNRWRLLNDPGTRADICFPALLLPLPLLLLPPKPKPNHLPELLGRRGLFGDGD